MKSFGGKFSLNDIDILNQLISDSARVELLSHYENFKAILDEPEEPDVKVEVLNIPEDAIVIKADRFRAQHEIFKGDKGECKRADYVIVSALKRKIIYIELKKTKEENNHIEKQLRGALCFIDYCKSLGQQFWGKNDFLSSFENRFISICHCGGLQKRRTSIEREDSRCDMPNMPLKIKYTQSIQFKILAGRS